MSLSYLLNANKLTLHASVLELQGVDQAGNVCAPLDVASNIVCANLNAEEWSGAWGVSGTLTVGDLLVCANAVTRTFTRLPVGADGSVLTANSAVSLGIEWV